MLLTQCEAGGGQRWGWLWGGNANPTAALAPTNTAPRAKSTAASCGQVLLWKKHHTTTSQLHPTSELASWILFFGRIKGMASQNNLLAKRSTRLRPPQPSPSQALTCLLGVKSVGTPTRARAGLALSELSFAEPGPWQEQEHGGDAVSRMYDRVLHVFVRS